MTDKVSPQQQTSDAADTTKTGPGVVAITVASFIAAASAAAAVFFIAPAPSSSAGPVTQLSAENKKPKLKDKSKNTKNEKGKVDKDKPDAAKIQYIEGSAYLLLEPIVLSIKPIGRSKHLRISIILETNSDDAHRLLSHSYHIKDVLNTYLRSVDSGEFENPAEMTRLRKQIARRIQSAVPQTEIKNVLITEFLLT